MFQKPIDKDEYALTMKDFTAENFDAVGLSLARGAGMKYMVLTARHHDGFCLFDSKHSIGDHTVMNTPAQRDLIKEYTDACTMPRGWEWVSTIRLWTGAARIFPARHVPQVSNGDAGTVPPAGA